MQISPSGLFLDHDSSKGLPHIKEESIKQAVSMTVSDHHTKLCLSSCWWVGVIIKNWGFLARHSAPLQLFSPGFICHLSTEFHRPSPQVPSPKGCQFALLPLEKNYTDYMENKRKQEPGYGLTVNAFTGQHTCFVCGEQGQKGFWKNLTRLG